MCVRDTLRPGRLGRRPVSHLQAMDSSHVSLCSLNLRSDMFDHFRCDRGVSLGLNLANMSKILKCMGNDDVVTLKSEDEGDTLTMMFEAEDNSRISDFEMKLMDIDSEHLGIPEQEYNTTIQMPSSEFQVRPAARACGRLVTPAGAHREGAASATLPRHALARAPMRWFRDAQRPLLVTCPSSAAHRPPPARLAHRARPERARRHVHDRLHEGGRQVLRHGRPRHGQHHAPPEHGREGGGERHHRGPCPTPAPSFLARLPPPARGSWGGIPRAPRRAGQLVARAGDSSTPPSDRRVDRHSRARRCLAPCARRAAQMEEPVELTFALRYLNFFTKATPLGATVTLSMSPDVPIVVSYPIGASGSLSFYLAPKIDEES